MVELIKKEKAPNLVTKTYRVDLAKLAKANKILKKYNLTISEFIRKSLDDLIETESKKKG